MALSKYFRFPFASSGDKAAVPDTVVPAGNVSYPQGYGPDYQLVKSDPQAKDIERDKMNQLFFDMSTALKEYQENGTPDWIDPSQNGATNFPYPLGARVRYSNGLIYVSQKAANNSTPAANTDWVEETGRLVRTTRFVRVSGVQNISINGGALTTTGASTWTRLPGTKFARVRVQGGGSGGAGGAGATGSNVSLGAPGASGSYGEAIFDAATLGASQTVVAGLASAGSSGLVGGTSSFGALLTAPGGAAAGGLNNQTPPFINGNGSASGTPTGANLLAVIGRSLHPSIALSAASSIGGSGGYSQFGPGAPGPIVNTNGIDATNIGSGGSGTAVNVSGGTATGGAGSSGAVFVEEYE